MRKRPSTSHTTPKSTKRGTLGKAALVVITLCLTASGLTLAGLGRIGAPYNAAPFGAGSPAPALPTPTVPNSFSPPNPSKEYIYAGGRLVATEEPVLTPPAAPTNLRLEEYTENAPPGEWGTAAYRLRWDDNATNEAGYKVESRQLVNGQWTLWAQAATVGVNVATYSLGGGNCSTRLFRVRATNGAGNSDYSNEHYVGLINCFWNGEPSSCTPPTALIVSEFRLRGDAGPNDEFVELYNNSDAPITVCTADRSGAWTVAARPTATAPVKVVFSIPAGTVIPARGHYLGVNSTSPGGYSLGNTPAGVSSTATGNATYNTDIGDDTGIALFKTADPAGFTLANRLDAVGFSPGVGAAADLYREGAGLPSVGGQNGDYTFFRKMTSASGGMPQDTGNNASDFSFVATDGGFYGSLQAGLGAPGPENLSSPVQRNSSFGMTNLDPTVGSSQPPNRVRDFASNPANNATFGTLSIRRHVTNNTNVNVTLLRFRVVSMTTWPAPVGVADLRPLTSGPVQVIVQGVTKTVQGTVVEQPPAQPNGGGHNSTMSVSLPQPLAPGASVDVQFLLGLQQTGSFNFLINIEALP